MTDIDDLLKQSEQRKKDGWMPPAPNLPDNRSQYAKAHELMMTGRLTYEERQAVTQRVHELEQEEMAEKRRKTAEMKAKGYEWGITSSPGGDNPSYGWKKRTLCFVATAVYGDIDAPQVQALRNFRDEVLANSAIGRRFVDMYYSGAGEKAANFIRNQLPSAIPLVRKCLDVIAEKYSEEARQADD